MNTFEDEVKDKYKKFDLFLENCDKLLKEIENKRKKEEIEKKNIAKNTPQKIKETNKSQHISNHSLYNTLKETDFHKTPLILLSDKQESDENQTYQKLMDLFIEENDTIKDLNFNLENIDDYLILQLYTALSLKARKIYLNSYEDKDINEKGRLFMKMINNIQFNPNQTKLTNRILTYINNGIINLEHNNLNEETINMNNYKEEQTEYLHSKEKDIPIIEAEDFYKKENNSSVKTSLNYNAKRMNLNNNYHQKEMSIEFYKETDDEKIENVDNITIKPYLQKVKKEDIGKFRYQKLKQLQKVIEVDDKEIEGLSEEKVEQLMQRIYSGKEKEGDKGMLEELNDSEECLRENENENIVSGSEDENENDNDNGSEMTSKFNTRREGMSLDKMQDNFSARNKSQQFKNYFGFDDDNNSDNDY